MCDRHHRSRREILKMIAAGSGLLVFPIGSLSFPAGAMVEPLACVVWGLIGTALFFSRRRG